MPEQAFEEIVKELGTKYRVGVDPAVLKLVVKAVDRAVKGLVEKGAYKSVRLVRAYFKVLYAKVWCLRQPLVSVDGLIVRLGKKYGAVFSSEVCVELNRLFSSLTADTLFAAGAFVVLTRGRERNPITENDVELVCDKYLLMPKPEWLC